jgi:hypothetical protein
LPNRLVFVCAASNVCPAMVALCGHNFYHLICKATDGDNMLLKQLIEEDVLHKVSRMGLKGLMK